MFPPFAADRHITHNSLLVLEKFRSQRFELQRLAADKHWTCVQFVLSHWLLCLVRHIHPRPYILHDLRAAWLVKAQCTYLAWPYMLLAYTVPKLGSSTHNPSYDNMHFTKLPNCMEDSRTPDRHPLCPELWSGWTDDWSCLLVKLNHF